MEKKKVREYEVGDTISCRDLDHLIASIKTLTACGYKVTADIDLGIIYIRGRHEQRC